MDEQTMTPPLNDEAQETKLVVLAMKQAQKQLEEGTASSQIITHFLRLGSVKAQVELEKIELENRLLEEKIQAERSGQQLNEMFAEVLAALKSYTYSPGDVDANLY
jgi:hypothetical protein